MLHVSKKFSGFRKFYLAGSGIQRAANGITAQLGQGVMVKAKFFDRCFGGCIVISCNRNFATMIELKTRRTTGAQR